MLQAHFLGTKNCLSTQYFLTAQINYALKLPWWMRERTPAAEAQARLQASPAATAAAKTAPPFICALTRRSGRLENDLASRLRQNPLKPRPHKTTERFGQRPGGIVNAGGSRQAQAAVVQKKSVQFRGCLNAAGILRQRALPIGIQGIAPQRVSQSCGVHPYLMARATAYAAGSQGQPLRRKRERDCRIGRSAEKQPQFLGIHCIGMPDM